MNKFFSTKMNKKLKIGLITHNFPNSKSERVNAGIFSYDLAKALSQKADVVVFSPGDYEGIKNINGVKTYFFKFRDKLGNLKIYNPVHILKFIQFFATGQKSLNKFILENPDIDFIIAMWAFPSGFFASRIYKQKGIPYAIYALGSDIYIYSKKPVLKKIIIKYLVGANILLADSPDLAQEIYLLSGRRALFLPSSSNISSTTQAVKKGSPKIILTFLGRLEKIKGIDIFMDALEDLDSAKFKVNIIGDGSLFNNIKERSKDLPWIKLWGNLSDFNKIAAILKNSDWLVIPSRSDSIPLVFSEAMKLSLPVIASDLPDLKYLVRKYKVGKTFKKGSSASLARTLKDILSGKLNKVDFTKNTLKAAEIFDLDKVSAKLIDLIGRNLKK